MKVPTQKDREAEKEAELYVLGNCFALDVDGSTIRIGPLSPSQWSLIQRSAEDRAEAH